MSSKPKQKPLSWKEPHPVDARRLVAEICRLKIHPALQGLFWRRYIIMQNVHKQDGKYSAIGWGDLLELYANPPGPTSSRGAIVTTTPAMITKCVEDWWQTIWASTAEIDQFMGELIELFNNSQMSELYELYKAYCQQWRAVRNDEFQIDLGGTPFMPESKHSQFVEACFGPSSQIMTLMKSGLAELHSKGGNVNSERGEFRQPLIFAPLGSDIDLFKGPLHTIIPSYLPRLKTWFAAKPDDKPGVQDPNTGHIPLSGDGGNAIIFNTRVTAVICEDFCHVLTKKGVFDFKNSLADQKAIAARLFHVCSGLTYEEVAGTNTQDRQMCPHTWDYCAPSIEASVQRGIIGKITPIPVETQGEGTIPVDLASGGGSGPGPSKNESGSHRSRSQPKTTRKMRRRMSPPGYGSLALFPPPSSCFVGDIGKGN